MANARVASSSARAPEPPLARVTDEQERWRLLRRRLRDLSHTVGIFAAVVVFALLFTLLNSRFSHLTNLGIIIQQSSILGIMATGMTFAIVSGEIDLSVGSMFAVSAMVFALVLQSGQSIYVAGATAIAVGYALGLVNGLLSVLFNVSTIIVTLGTLNIYSGIVLWISNGLPVSNFKTTGWFFRFSQNNLPGPAGLTWIPDIAIAWIVLTFIAWIVLTKTAFGQRIYAVGSNRQAAVNAGISASRVRVQALTAVGFAAGLAGILSVGQYDSASPGAGSSYNLSVIAAVIIGGAALTGGRGTVIASALGVLLIGEVNNGLIIAGVNLYGQIVAQGALVVLAVAIDRLVHGNNWYSAAIKRRWRSVGVAHHRYVQAKERR
jgi:ribose transport system permease protein